MKYTNHILTILSVFLTIVLFLPLYSIDPQFSPEAGQLSEEERAMFDLISSLSESELKQLEHTIEDEVGKMAPEEQIKFWNEVDREAERLQPKIEHYIKDYEEAIKPEEPMVQPIEQKKPPKPKSVVPKEKPAEVKKKREIKNKITQAEETIVGILQSINTYLSTAQTIPEFDDEIEDWAEENKIKYWRTDLTWSFFKNQVEELAQKLHYLIERDQNNNFKHLEIFVKDESLFNNLSQLEQNLDKYVPQIQEITFDVDTLSPQSEQALQGITASLFEAINILHVIGALDSVLSRYKPTAEQLKKEEEESIERACREGTIKPRLQPVVCVGIPQEDTGFVTTPSSSLASSSSYSRERSTKPSSSSNFPSSSTFPVQDGSPPAEKKGAPTSSPTPEKKSKPAQEKSKPSVVPKKEEPTDKIADDYIKDIIRGLDGATVAIEDGRLDSIKNHTLSTTSYSSDLAEVYLPESIRHIRRTSETARALELRIKKRLKGALKDKYQKALKEEINLHKKTLEKVANQVRSLRTSEANIPDDKAYAYLGGLRKERVPEVAQKIPSPSSLYTLEDRIRDLLSVIK